MNVSRLLSQARIVLAGQPDCRLEAEVLLCHVLGVSRAWLYANGSQAVEDRHCERFLRCVERRASGEPIAYITGTREFWSLPLKITSDVLVPRPETELLVEIVLPLIPTGVRWRVADLGTGSGAIALALAHERPDCEIHATDISGPALALARENAVRLDLSRIRFHQGNWLDGLTGRFHVIVSNPPYIAMGDPHLRMGDCRFEPGAALSPGADGMSAIRAIATGARDLLDKDGVLAFEHGYDQGGQSRTLLNQLGYVEIETISDLAGLDRITVGRLSLVAYQNRPTSCRSV